jgi:hypothetical protein
MERDTGLWGGEQLRWIGALQQDLPKFLRSVVAFGRICVVYLVNGSPMPDDRTGRHAHVVPKGR